MKGQHGNVVTIAIPSPGERPTLAALAKDDPEAERIARECCMKRTGGAEDSRCAMRCVEAAGLGQCQKASVDCEAVARANDDKFQQDDLSMCRSLLATCLEQRGVSRANLLACTSACASRRIAEVCQ